MSSIISPEDITSLFLFGTATKPGGNGPISQVRIRPPGNGVSTTVDVNAYMGSNGPGRFANASRFPLVQQFFNAGSGALAPGTYNEAQLMAELNISIFSSLGLPPARGRGQAAVRGLLAQRDRLRFAGAADGVCSKAASGQQEPCHTRVKRASGQRQSAAGVHREPAAAAVQDRQPASVLIQGVGEAIRRGAASGPAQAAPARGYGGTDFGATRDAGVIRAG